MVPAERFARCQQLERPDKTNLRECANGTALRVLLVGVDHGVNHGFGSRDCDEHQRVPINSGGMGCSKADLYPGEVLRKWYSAEVVEHADNRVGIQLGQNAIDVPIADMLFTARALRLKTVVGIDEHNLVASRVESGKVFDPVKGIGIGLVQGDSVGRAGVVASLVMRSRSRVLCRSRQKFRTDVRAGNRSVLVLPSPPPSSGVSMSATLSCGYLSSDAKWS